MSSGPQLKSRRLLQPIDNKLARLDAVSAWTEEPAQAQAESVTEQPLKRSVTQQEVVEPPTPQPAPENSAKGRSWASKEKEANATIQASFRITIAMHNRLKKAVQRLDNGTTMTDVIIQGIEAELSAIEAYLDKA